MKKERVPEADYLFEVGWEVCNKVGGIYTVIMSKTAQILQYYKNLILIGKYTIVRREHLKTPYPPGLIIAGLIDLKVERNAYGRQIDSFIGGSQWFVFLLLGTGLFFTLAIRLNVQAAGASRHSGTRASATSRFTTIFSR